MHVAFYLEILKKEGNLGVHNIQRGSNLFKEILCDCVNWIQLIHNRNQERILFEHCNGFSVYFDNIMTSRATVSV